MFGWGILVGLAIGLIFGMINGYLYSIFESIAGYIQVKFESKKSPYIKDVTETNLFVAKKEDELNGKEEKVPAIGFDLTSYMDNEEDEEGEPEPDEEERTCGFKIK